jgi:hypothetical protein
MPTEPEHERGGILQILLDVHRTLTRIELVGAPFLIAIAVAVGWISPFDGAAVCSVMLFLAWVYFDLSGHRNHRRTRRNPGVPSESMPDEPDQPQADSPSGTPDAEGE